VFKRKLAHVLAGAVVASVACAGTAAAAAPTLLTVGDQNRHPTATFSMPGADDATIYFATKPDRATDGRFLEENVEDLDFLTTDEIQGGQWLDSAQLDPGRYYVLLRATDNECFGGDPACMEGFSNMLTLAVPRPVPRYRGAVRVSRYLSTVDLHFRVAPLGERLRYRVCWTRVDKPRKCVRSTVDGYSWNSAATDQIEVSKREMPNRTAFAWYVDGRKVASGRVRIPRL
jgi:hypothetical protein